jgi:uncharacterized secreted repeat protein (TIGR03808 family)
MDPERRKLLTWSASALGAAGAAFSPPIAEAAPTAPATPPISALGLDATHMGVRPGSTDDQSAIVQRAIDRAAAARAPLALPPGVYRAGGLMLPSGAQIVGIRGATRLVFSGGTSLIAARGAEFVALTGLALDGMARPLPPYRGLVHFEATGMRIADCAVVASGGHGIRLAAAQGEVTGTSIEDAADVALLSADGRGVTISRNSIANAGNNGIVVIRAENGADGTQVLDNRIANTRNRSGGTGQFGNAINAYRAADVIVRGNLIRGCAFSGVRGNTASAIQIVGNTVHDAGEVALYSEFAFEGAVIAHNIVDGARTGVSVANFNEGGHLAVVQGNIFRNLTPATGDPAGEPHGTGIYVEADTAVSGNVVEGARAIGIAIGWGPYLRNVVATGNVVRRAGIGIAVSVVPGAGSALIASNVLSECERAIVGMDHARPVTADLVSGGADRHPHLSIAGNRVG